MISNSLEKSEIGISSLDESCPLCNNESYQQQYDQLCDECRQLFMWLKPCEE